MSVGTGRQNIKILFWKEQFHFWEYITGFSPALHLQFIKYNPLGKGGQANFFKSLLANHLSTNPGLISAIANPQISLV
jgi:hypothetical protein